MKALAFGVGNWPNWLYLAKCIYFNSAAFAWKQGWHHAMITIFLPKIGTNKYFSWPSMAPVNVLVTVLWWGPCIIISRVHQCSRIRILCFFSDFKKHDFLRIFEMMFQKNVKSHKKYQVIRVCWMSIEILASKLPDVMGILIGIYHTSSQLHSFLCPHFWARCLMMVTVTYRYWLPVIE